MRKPFIPDELCAPADVYLDWIFENYENAEDAVEDDHGVYVLFSTFHYNFEEWVFIGSHSQLRDMMQRNVRPTPP